MAIPKQGVWFVWDSRGGTQADATLISPVDFDLKDNEAAWRRSGATVTGSIEEGHLTYKHHGVHIEIWREDQPNPTPYTKVVNPDTYTEADRLLGCKKITEFV